MKHYLFICLVCIPLLWNLLKPGFYTSHDGEWMVIRLTAFHQSLRAGQVPVRWTQRLNHQYGYPVMNFLYPLPFYLSEPIYLISKNPATAVQTTMLLGVLSMVVGMFLFLMHYGNWPAIVGSISYVYSPYVAFNLYQRGSLGEIVAMGIVPWIFWSIRSSKLSVAAILLAALITSHNVVAIIFFPFIMGYMMVRIYRVKSLPQKKKLATNYLLLTIISLALSASFWLPAFYELRFVRASQIAIADFQNEYLSFSEAIKRAGVTTTVFTGGLPLLFLTKASSWFWQSVKILTIIQFPWRLLSLLSFLAATVVARLLILVKKNYRVSLIVGAIIATTSIFSARNFMLPKSFINRPPEYYQTNDDTTTVRAEYTPIWVKNLPSTRPEVPTRHYYPGWRAFVDGKEVEVKDPVTTNGLLSVAARFDPVNTRFVWSETYLRMMANLTTAIGGLSLLAWFRLSLS
jgi:hypothetical protein